MHATCMQRNLSFDINYFISLITIVEKLNWREQIFAVKTFFFGVNRQINQFKTKRYLQA